MSGQTVPSAALSGLPTEVRTTLATIGDGGPFPHNQDGTLFRNREGHLPIRPSGYYREYTVDTPGAADRGSRRIVIGLGGETYDTDDHDSTFVEVV